MFNTRDKSGINEKGKEKDGEELELLIVNADYRDYGNASQPFAKLPEEEEGMEKSGAESESDASHTKQPQDHKFYFFDDLPEELAVAIAEQLVPCKEKLEEKDLHNLARFAMANRKTHRIADATFISIEQQDESDDAVKKKIKLGTYGELRQILNRPFAIKREIHELEEGYWYKKMTCIQDREYEPCFIIALFGSSFCVMFPSVGLAIGLGIALKTLIPVGATIATGFASGIIPASIGMGTLIYCNDLPRRTNKKIKKLRKEEVPKPLVMRK